MMQTFGLVEAFDRHGALLARAPIKRWPVTVGRGLDCDLVLDDPFVAPTHLRIDRPEGAPRSVSVDVLETRNGADLRRKHYGQGERFDWPVGVPLEIGRTRVSLRLADTAIADEQPLPKFPWRNLATTVALVLLLVAAVLGAAWLDASDVTKYLKSLPGVLVGVALLLGGWSSLWALSNKVFDGRMQFWRHVRIACTTYLVIEVVSNAANLAAFSFSWEALSRFDNLLVMLALAGGIYAHLAAVLPRRRVGLAWTLAALVVLGMPAWLGAQWLSNMRLSKELYASRMFPPSLRVAPAVPIAQFLKEAESLRGKLDGRLLNDGHADDDDDE